MSFNRCTLAVLKDGMRINYSCAAPSGDSGCTHLLSGIFFLIGMTSFFIGISKPNMHFLNSGCSVRYRIYDSIEELSQGSEEHQTARAGGGGPIPARLGHADAAQPAPHSMSALST